MYKGASANLQRRSTRIIEADTATYVSEDDLVLSADNMGLRECELEQADLARRKTQMENELAGAKARGDRQAIRQLGYSIQGVCTRLGLLGRRIKEVRRQDRESAFMDAAYEVLTPEQFRAVKDRQNELSEERKHTAA